MGILWITAFILLGVLTISDMRVETAAMFLMFGFLIHLIGTFIFINPFVKYSRRIHGVGSLRQLNSGIYTCLIQIKKD